ncbi:hypothetical protein Mal65_23450 [Crateriforma conspicua]|nr:hypothetical protein Mal65_23450 [Crateriforma conspicua]
MIAMTTNNSTSVNAERTCRVRRGDGQPSEEESKVFTVRVFHGMEQKRKAGQIGDSLRRSRSRSIWPLHS